MKSAMCLSVIRRWNLSSVVFRTSADGLGFVVPPLGGQTSGPPKGGTTNQGLRTIAILVGDPFEETVLLVGQGLLALALDLRQQLVHPAFVGGLLLLLALQPGGAAALQPALDEVLFLLARRGRLVALQACVALREIVAEQGVLAARLKQNPLLPA